ncbi:hypothetical protein K504DRAFT_485059 [Pleomassaria siparia CBS 279.74]|uniref:Uncharacterized protein n=1 Tax=Pleomassaria siparia CBS 279.74 TaxID=1314801 RepID=A0A6G1JV22_9PLEO|nr:hypothetical protein K504DRAFT_485059 [Pleomassaria siparia CBS 279.74]
MRFSYVSVIALVTSAIASPVLERRADAVSILTDLYATIQTYTGAINATLATLSTSPSVPNNTAAIAEVGAQLTSITDAIKSSTSSVKTITPCSSAKRSPLERSISVQVTHPKEKRQIAEVGVLLSLIITEIFATVTGAVAILGLAGLLVFLNPLTSSLSLLILAVEVLVDVLLIAVIVLLDSVLTALALGVAGL